jgi:hypothetical protein
MTSAHVTSASALAGGYAARIRHAVVDWPLLIASFAAVLGLGLGVGLALMLDLAPQDWGFMTVYGPWVREVGVLLG